MERTPQKKISCLDDCYADCCIKGNILELAPEEVESLKLAGTEILELIPPNLERGQVFIRTMGPIRIEDYLAQGVGRYRLMSDCNYLNGQKCRTRNNRQQPQVSKRLKPGSRNCREIRGD